MVVKLEQGAEKLRKCESIIIGKREKFKRGIDQLKKETNAGFENFQLQVQSVDEFAARDVNAQWL